MCFGGSSRLNVGNQAIAVIVETWMVSSEEKIHNCN
jgi:hypothetical protein